MPDEPGQLELEQYKREDAKHDAEMYRDEIDNERT